MRILLLSLLISCFSLGSLSAQSVALPSDSPDNFIGVDFEGTIMLLSALLVESERKRESLHQLEILGQYQLGLLAFVGGVALCYVFVFGMRLR